MQDVGFLVFSGDVEIAPGVTVTCQNAYEEAFDRERVERSRKKFGYVPATRAALKSDRV